MHGINQAYGQAIVVKTTTILKKTLQVENGKKYNNHPKTLSFT